MTREQKIVGVGAAGGILAMIASVAAIARLWPIDGALIDVSSRLAYTLQLNAFASLPLLAGVMVVGSHRFLSAAIDPAPGLGGATLRGLRQDSVANQYHQSRGCDAP